MNKLKAKRRAADVTLAQLARKLGVAMSTLSRIESGDIKPSAERSKAIESAIEELATAKEKLRQTARELGLSAV